MLARGRGQYPGRLGALAIQTYIIRRVLLLIPTLFFVTVFVFLAVRFLPGDVIDLMASELEDGIIDPEYRAKVADKFSLNTSIPQQYVTWIGDILRADFGQSFLTDRPVFEDVRRKLPVSMQLGAMAMAFSITMAIPVGVTSAVWQDTWVDYVTRSMAILLLAVPSFWLALIAIVYGFAFFGWVPPIQYRNVWDEPLTNLQILWVPAIILGGALAGSVMRLTRPTMLEVLRQDYVRTARAKGLQERHVIVRHALRNAALPVVTVVGLQVGLLVGGTVVLERIFSIPGMGNFLLTSLEQRDYPAVQAVVLLSALVVVFSNLIVDLSYALIDPRIRYA